MFKKIFIALIINALSAYAFSLENTDSLFLSAIKHSQMENYEEALKEAEKAIKSDSTRYDILIFMANVYAWQSEYDEALNYISQAYKVDSTNKELYDSWLNILLWSRNYKALLETISLAKNNNYNDEYNISLKTILAYRGLGNYKAGIDYAEKNHIVTDSAATRYVYYEMLRLNKQNFLSAYYSLDLVERNKPGHIAYIDYGFRISRHSLITRLNYSRRFATDDFQIEVDYYHVFKNGHYLYSNYGSGIKRELYPTHRAGLEYYFPLTQKTEVSFGGRYFNAENNNVYIATGHLGAYYSNIWLGFRPYYIISNDGNSLSTVINGRIFKNNPQNYWGVELAYGNSPDERFIANQAIETFRLETYRFKIEKNFLVGAYNEMKISAGYAYEEYASNVFRNRFIIELIFKRKL